MVLFVCAAFLMLFRGPRFTEAPPNEFCHVQIISNVHGAELPTELEIGRNDGFYFTVVMEKKPNCPTEIEDLPMQDYADWKTFGYLTPRKEWPSEDGIRFDVQHYPQDHDYFQSKIASMNGKTSRLTVISGGSRLKRREAGWAGHPERPEGIPQDTRCAYGFISLPRDAITGDEYVMEVYLIPHAHRVSAQRSVMGPKVLLWRGLIKCASDDGAPLVALNSN